MSNSSNNNKREKLEPGSSNIIERLLLRTPEQLKLYCKLLDNEKKQDLYQNFAVNNIRKCSSCEIEEAEQTRKPLLEQLVKGTINSILAAVSLVNISRSESQLPGKTDDKPRTCLNDPTVDNQLQRSL